MADAIEQELSDFEKTLYSFDYDSELYGYKTWIDVDSFVDYFILNELTCNYDAGTFPPTCTRTSAANTACVSGTLTPPVRTTKT